MSAQYKALLKWVAENVYEISSVKIADRPGEHIEIDYWLDDEHERESVKGSGDTVWVAFIRALNKAREEQALRAVLKKMPKFAKRYAETEINKNFYSKETISAPANKKDVPRRRRRTKD